MELNDQGEYVPVELQTKPDVMTGGVFMIRQVCPSACLPACLPACLSVRPSVCLLVCLLIHDINTCVQVLYVCLCALSACHPPLSISLPLPPPLPSPLPSLHLLPLISPLPCRASLGESTWPCSRWWGLVRRPTSCAASPSPPSPSGPATSGTDTMSHWTPTRNRTWRSERRGEGRGGGEGRRGEGEGERGGEGREGGTCKATNSSFRTETPSPSLPLPLSLPPECVPGGTRQS